MNFIRLSILLCLLVALSPAAAQDESATGWTIEKRFILEPVEPPEGWTFEGTIVVTCPYGICGLRSDWETRRVLNFTNGMEVRLALYQGTLSPDKRWYAAARGEHWCMGSCSGSSRTIYSIAVFDISGENPRRYYSIRWPMGYSQMTAEFDEPPLVWYDNEHLIYPTKPDGSDMPITQVLNPFSEEVSNWTGDDQNCIRCSPDRTRNIEYSYYENHYSLVDLVTQETVFGFDFSTNRPLPAWAVSWSPNSRFFLGVTTTQDQHDYLTLYSRDGRVIGRILQIDNALLDFLPHGFDLAWSPDNEQFWMSVKIAGTLEVHHYLVNIPEQRILDLDLNSDIVYTGGWSPDSTRIALNDYQNYGNIILDISTFQMYHLDALDINEDSVIGWRGD